LLYFIPVGDIAAACSSIDPVLFAMAVSLQFLARGAAAYRMKIVADNQGMALSRWRLFRILLITQLYSLALPGTLAGGGITWLKCVQAGASKDAAAATVVFNRAIGLTFMMIVGTAAWIFDRAPEVPWLLAGVAAGTPLMIFLGTRPRDTPNLTSVNNGDWSWTTAMAHIRKRFWMFRSLPAPAKLLLLSSSLAQEFLGGAVLLGFALALGLEVGLAQVLWIRAGLMLLLMMPMSVAGLGIREASLVGLGSLIGIDPASAMAWSLVTFAGVLIVAGVGGLMELQGSPGRLQPEQPENRP
jgi:uncharacterized membrane protein YbhN (UPF0104 family)